MPFCLLEKNTPHAEKEFYLSFGIWWLA